MADTLRNREQLEAFAARRAKNEDNLEAAYEKSANRLALAFSAMIGILASIGVVSLIRGVL